MPAANKFLNKPTFFPILPGLILLFLSGSGLFSQPAQNIRVADIRFSLERSPFGGERWLAIDVMVDIRGNIDRTAANPEFVDQVNLMIGLANNAGNASQLRLEYFWTQVEAPTVKRGIRHFRFYLPPEQVERGRMNNNEPYAWYVQITQGLPGTAANQEGAIIAVSQNLREQARLDRFLSLLEEQKDKGAGILLPQAETPFRDLYAEDTPVIRGIRRAD